MEVEVWLHLFLFTVHGLASWPYFELDTYHDCMWEGPEGLVEILVGKRMEKARE